ncbi:MAG: FAD-dependent oxidoreductase, partial [Limnochordia bacterium]|nr:FAD-dependent oxidoreductase [Limnochordia bacterium]
MEGSYDVVIIGAGIVGTTIARELARYRLKILILEKGIDVAMGATKANSAIVHGGYAEPSTTLKGQLCLKGRQAFAKLDAELNFGFRQTGSL